MAERGSAGRRGWLALLAGAVAALVPVATAPAKPKPAGAKGKHVGSCNAHRKHASTVTPRVLVYAKHGGEDLLGSPVTTYYACVRPAGAPVLVGNDAPGEGEYPSNETTYPIKAAGTFIAALSSSGAGEAAGCSKSEPSGDCPAVNYWIQTLDARTHRRLALSTGPSVTAFTVSSAGAVAWIEQPTTTVSVLHAIVLHRGAPRQLAGTVQTLDMGAIPSHSLGLHGLNLSWADSGQKRSLTLH